MAVVSSLPVLRQIRMPMAQPSLPDFQPPSPEIEEVEEPPLPPAAPEGRIFVAVGKGVKECRSTVAYAAKNAGGKTVVLLHVHQPSKTIPMQMGGSFPVDRVKPAEVKAHRERERKKMDETLNQYKEICEKERVAVDKLVIEMDDVEKGILQLVQEHGITNLVMGTAAHKHLTSCQKMQQPKSKKAVGVAQRSPPACHISFVCKGNLICTREANVGGTLAWVRPLSPAARTSTTGSQPSPSLRSPSMPSRLPRLTNPIQDFFRSKSYNRILSSHGSRMLSPSVEDRQRTMLESPATSAWVRPSPSPGSTAWSTCNGGASSTSSGSVERDDQSEGGSLTLPTVTEYEEDGTFASLPNELDAEEADLFHAQLDQAMEEAEVCRREAYEESNRRRKAEKDAIEAARRARATESLYNKEMKLRREMEVTLQQEIQQLENIKIQQQEVYDELQQARNQHLALEADIASLNRIVTELEEKLAASKDLLSTAQRERDELQRERDEAVVEAEELRQRNEDAANAASGSSRSPDFSEFGFDELADATCNFDESMKIGEGGCGSVYKGLLRHTLVAVKVLRSHSVQDQCQFQQEVNVLSKVRHPNLVTLIGTGPEASAIIYEYLHNGSLEDRLSCKDNSPPLPWQTRIQIATDICSALIFLHSNKPDGIVHCDLKPANILLDSNYTAKLGDFGISRLIRQMNSATTLCLETEPKGTVGYMDPDFIYNGVLTPRSDVYSFGVIILRLLTGKPVLGIIKLVRDAFDSGNLHQILDGIAGDWPFIQAKRLAEIGLRCCGTNPKSRPDLASEVLKVLQPMTELAMSKKLGICPIFLEVMQDPQVAADGFTYEAEAIQGWLDDGHKTSPMTNIMLVHKDLIPNRALKSAIQEWLHQT